MNTVPIAVVCSVVVGLAAGCARNPVSGRPELTIVSARRERELGEAEARKIAATTGLYEDAALTGYVRRVGERLARVSPRQDVRYTFAIVDMPEPNALSLPGGQIYVSRGLLVLLSSEDELAGVLGHEVAHVAARHAAQRLTRAAPIGILSAVGAAVTDVVSPTLGDLVGGLGGAAGALVLAPYSRGQEQQADDVGQRLAAQAGWDPAGLPAALRALERDESLHERDARRASFFATHPPLPDRVAVTEARAATLPRAAAASLAADRTAFLEALDGLPVRARACDGVFDGQTFRHPELDFQAEFPAGWKTANGRTLVGASAPDRRAIVAIEVAGGGDDPAAALRAAENTMRLDFARNAERLHVNGLPAVRTTTTARMRGGRIALEVTWIAHAGRVYSVTGAFDLDRVAAFTPAVRAIVQSFRPLTPRDRAAIRQTRLRIVSARRRETLADVLARAHASWSLETAVAVNGRDASARLEAGEPVKIAVDEPYEP